MKLWIVLGGLLVVGCSKAPEPGATVATAKVEAAQEKAAANEVALDANQQRQANIVVEAVRVRSLPQHIQVNGRLTVNENRTWHVGAITDGRVIRVTVVPGDRVQKDQLLAGMHSHDIHEARAEYRKAVAESARLKMVLSYAQKQRDRAQRLLDLKAASVEQVEHAETELNNAKTAVQNAETEVTRARTHIVEFLQVSLEEHDDHKEGEQEHEGDLIPVKAPAAGIVMSRNVTAGSVTSPGQEMFLIADLSVVWMIAAVNEEHLGKLRMGMAVKVMVQAYPERAFSGRITKFGEQLDSATRTMPVRVELENRQGLLKPEMYATAQITIVGTSEAIFIPQPATQQVDGKTTVFVKRGGDRFEARSVETGRVVDNQVEVLRGLRGGEEIVTQGSFTLKSQMLKGSLGE